MGIFEYVAVLTSIIIGLGITHLLRGVAGLIQHPEQQRVYWVHLVWVAYLFFTLIFWWWWEFRLGTIETWTFHLYLFVVVYAFNLFLACALIFPASLSGYRDYKDYFYSRRRWLFGLIAFSYLLDVFDTLLKGVDYFHSLGLEYPVSTLVQLSLFVVAMVVRNERFHAVFALAMLAYQVSWALRMFGTAA